MSGKHGIVCMGLLMLLSSCHDDKQVTASGLQRKDFQTEVNGQYTDLFTLSNKKGMEVCITNYGARVVSILVPDKNGKREDVVCGFSTIGEYMEQRQNFGSTVGRYIGRILNARFTLDGVEHKLVPNNGKSGHISHGGNPGFADRIWKVEQADTYTVRLSYLSPDGENGFPGNLKVTLVYSLGEDENALDLTYEATTDAPTVLNLSHHSFFNISGDFTKSVEDQQLWVDADRFTPYDDKPFRSSTKNSAHVWHSRFCTGSNIRTRRMKLRTISPGIIVSGYNSPKRKGIRHSIRSCLHYQ